MSFSQDFLENAILLMLTAGITSFLIPYILKRIENQKLKEQKEYEAELVRQSKIIDSQIQLLENLANLLWEFQISAILVSYYSPVEQPDLYNQAVQKYQEKTLELVTKIRSEISKALRLTTPEIYQELKSLFYDQLTVLDANLNQLILDQKESEQYLEDQWYKFNQFAVFELSEMVDNALNKLAEELHLKVHTTKQSKR